MSVATWSLGVWLPSSWHSAARLAVTVPFGVMVYAGLVWVFRLRALNDLIRIMREHAPERRPVDCL